MPKFLIIFLYDQERHKTVTKDYDKRVAVFFPFRPLPADETKSNFEEYVILFKMAVQTTSHQHKSRVRRRVEEYGLVAMTEELMTTHTHGAWHPSNSRHKHEKFELCL